VKGKNVPISVFELIGLKGETDAALLKKARCFEEAIALFRGRRFAEAQAAFAAVTAEFGPDHAGDVYAENCRTLNAAPPPPDWDGSRALTEK
jgi:adenylate cyclase